MYDVSGIYEVSVFILVNNYIVVDIILKGHQAVYLLTYMFVSEPHTLKACFFPQCYIKYIL